jgi:hypothetical protein
MIGKTGRGSVVAKPPTPRTGKWFARVVASVSSVSLAILALAGSELLARRSMPGYLARARGLHVFSHTLGWVNRSGVSVALDGNQVSINRRGDRGRELAVPRRRGPTRVIVLGDSIAFGLGVADHETFTSLLDERDNGIEAANLAVSGYGPDQELLVLLRDGPRYQAEVVILAFCLANDFADAELPVALYDGRMPKPRFLLVGGRLVLDRSSVERPGSWRFLQWVSDESLLFNLAAATGRTEPQPSRDWHERYAHALRDDEHALQLCLALLREMSRVCRERGVRLLVPVFPDRAWFRERASLPARFLQSLAADGIDAIDMKGYFQAVGPRLKAVALDGTGHLNAVGHRVASEVLEQQILAGLPTAMPAAPPGSPDS